MNSKAANYNKFNVLLFIASFISFVSINQYSIHLSDVYYWFCFKLLFILPFFYNVAIWKEQGRNNWKITSTNACQKKINDNNKR